MKKITPTILINDHFYLMPLSTHLIYERFRCLAGKYTWANHLQNQNFEKLDRILTCTDFESKFPWTTVQTLSRNISDHTPLFINTNYSSHLNISFRRNFTGNNLKIWNKIVTSLLEFNFQDERDQLIWCLHSSEQRANLFLYMYIFTLN